MTKHLTINLLSFVSIVFFQQAYSQKAIKHFIFFSRSRELIHDSTFYANTGISGAQITYSWKQLEQQKDVYDFSEIEEDLAFLKSKGKKLFVQVQDVTFDSTRFAVPKYILTDPVYHGGANSQYELISGNKLIKTGWVARRWDPSVAERFHRLLVKLSQQFDGRIEGINLAETSVEFPEKSGLLPTGFSRYTYLGAIKKNMQVLRENFKKSIPLQYANFMPGDSYDDLKKIYDYANRIKLGMGGPDLKVYSTFQMENSYPLIRKMAGIAPTGVAVQEGNYNVINPKTGKQVTVEEILGFAKNYLMLDYVFWYAEEPYYSRQVLPLLESLKK
ncbi:MAG TPA: hypothetical protein VKR32_05450 [Puia sp.]|nr:hypothetical protein [Puia sp.]